MLSVCSSVTQAVDPVKLKKFGVQLVVSGNVGVKRTISEKTLWLAWSLLPFPAALCVVCLLESQKKYKTAGTTNIGKRKPNSEKVRTQCEIYIKIK